MPTTVFLILLVGTHLIYSLGLSFGRAYLPKSRPWLWLNLGAVIALGMLAWLDGVDRLAWFVLAMAIMYWPMLLTIGAMLGGIIAVATESKASKQALTVSALNQENYRRSLVLGKTITLCSPIFLALIFYLDFFDLDQSQAWMLTWVAMLSTCLLSLLTSALAKGGGGSTYTSRYKSSGSSHTSYTSSSSNYDGGESISGGSYGGGGHAGGGSDSFGGGDFGGGGASGEW